MQIPDIEKLEKIWKTANRLALLGSFIVCGLIWIFLQNLKCPSYGGFIPSILFGGIITYNWLYPAAIIKGCYSKCPEIIPFVIGVVPLHDRMKTEDGQVLNLAHTPKESVSTESPMEYYFVTEQNEVNRYILDFFHAVRESQPYSLNLLSRFGGWIFTIFIVILIFGSMVKVPEIDGVCKYPSPVESAGIAGVGGI